MGQHQGKDHSIRRVVYDRHDRGDGGALSANHTSLDLDPTTRSWWTDALAGDNSVITHENGDYLPKESGNTILSDVLSIDLEGGKITTFTDYDGVKNTALYNRSIRQDGNSGSRRTPL